MTLSTWTKPSEYLIGYKTGKRKPELKKATKANDSESESNKLLELIFKIAASTCAWQLFCYAHYVGGELSKYVDFPSKSKTCLGHYLKKYLCNEKFFKLNLGAKL